MRSVSLLFVLMMTGLLGYGQDLSVVQIYTSPFKQGDTKWKELKTVDHENRPHFSAWIYDGYITGKKNGKTYNLVHCNWGWGGDNNGYYLCEVFNTGTGAEFPDSGCDETQDYYYKYNLEYSIVSR